MDGRSAGTVMDAMQLLQNVLNDGRVDCILAFGSHGVGLCGDAQQKEVMQTCLFDLQVEHKKAVIGKVQLRADARLDVLRDIFPELRGDNAFVRHGLLLAVASVISYVVLHEQSAQAKAAVSDDRVADDDKT